MRAVILAGGKGTRLRPYTTLIPKPLVPLGGRYSILEIVLMQLAKAGFTHVTLAVNHLSHLIMAYFGDGSRWNIRLDYSLEDQPLSTIGPLTLIDDLPDDFLVMNGDILCDLDYRAFFEAHVARGSDISVVGLPAGRQGRLRRPSVHADLDLEHFQEKPSLSFDVSMGVFCLNRRRRRRSLRGRPYGFDDLMLDGLAHGRPVKRGAVRRLLARHRPHRTTTSTRTSTSRARRAARDRHPE